jgi:hypothetical protein
MQKTNDAPIMTNHTRQGCLRNLEVSMRSALLCTINAMPRPLGSTADPAQLHIELRSRDASHNRQAHARID